MTGSNLFNRVIGLLQIRCDNSVEEIVTEVHFYEERAIALHIKLYFCQRFYIP